MAATIGTRCTAKAAQLLVGPTGINASLASGHGGGDLPPAVDASQIRVGNVAADLAERSTGVQYPAVNVYCEKITNELTEKFQTFSGTVQVAIELRYSQDRLDGLERALEFYAGAVMQMLNQNRGDWADGMYYCGRYQVTFGGVKHGGKNFLQAAKVTFEIGVGIN